VILKGKKSLALTSIIIFGLFIGFKVSFVNSAIITDYQSDIFRVVNNVLDETQEYNQSSIDIVSLSTNVTSSQLILSFVGVPVIDQFHGYRVIIDWNKQLHIWLINAWPNVTWERIIGPKSSFTVCYAGGVSGFGVANGSYSEFYDSSGGLLFAELHNNSIALDGNSIIFTVNQTYVPTSPFNPYNETLGFHINNIVIFTNYNTTLTESYTNGNSISNVVWMDALPQKILSEYLFHLGGLNPWDAGTSSIFIISSFVIAVTIYLIYERRRLKLK